MRRRHHNHPTNADDTLTNMRGGQYVGHDGVVFVCESGDGSCGSYGFDIARETYLVCSFNMAIRGRQSHKPLFFISIKLALCLASHVT